MLQIKNTLGGGKPEGMYVWKKCENDAGHTFIDYIVSDKETAYPDGAVHTDGYWYEKVVEGAKVAIGEISVDSGYITSYTIEHGLGVKPKKIIFSAIGLSGSHFSTGIYDAENSSKTYVTSYSGSSGMGSFTVTDTSITIKFNIEIYMSRIYWYAETK